MNDLKQFHGKRILITGGSGFLGRALIARLKKEWNPASIRVLARDEGKLLALKQEFDVDITPGDVHDGNDVAKAMRGANQVFHLAGFKHLPLAETESEQAILTNVIGSINVLENAVSMDVDMVLGVSTDKAYNPMNCYGMTKRLMEYLFAQYHREWGWSDRIFRTVRYGNVLGSTGSVIDIWRAAAELGQPLRVTDPNMTRFFFRVEDAVQTIFDCLEQSTDATPFIPKMKAVRMHDLASVCAEILSNRIGKPVGVEVVGLRPGEKLHEGMADDAQSDAAEKYTKEEIYHLVQGII